MTCKKGSGDGEGLDSVDAVVESVVDSVVKEGGRQKRKSWAGFDVDKAKEYYAANLEGEPRGRVAKLDPSFYRMLTNRGWVDDVLPPSLRGR